MIDLNIYFIQHSLLLICILRLDKVPNVFIIMLIISTHCWATAHWMALWGPPLGHGPLDGTLGPTTAHWMRMAVLDH